VQGFCQPNVEGGFTAMWDLLEKQPRLSAVITGNELIYNGASIIIILMLILLLTIVTEPFNICDSKYKYRGTL
jgi:hypothetical protein